MDDIKKFLKRLWCFITGGHEYNAEDLHAHYDSDRKVYTFRNRCCKCGAPDRWEVPADDIMPELVRNMEVAWDE